LKKNSLTKLKDEVIEKQQKTLQNNSRPFSEGYGRKFGVQTDRVDKVNII
jgi:hypothetical protein